MEHFIILVLSLLTVRNEAAHCLQFTNCEGFTRNCVLDGGAVHDSIDFVLIE